MGLNLSRPTPSQPQPSQGQAPAAPQEEESYQQYDISADRQMMTQTLVNSPEVDALASQIEVYNLESIVSFGAGAADEISKCSDVVLNSMNLSQLDDSSAMLNTRAKNITVKKPNNTTSKRSRRTPASSASCSETSASSWTKSSPSTTPWAMKWTRSMSS